MVCCPFEEYFAPKERHNVFILALGGSRKYPHTTGGISEFRRGGGLHRLEFRGHGGGVHWTGIPKAWGDFQECNFYFGVVKSLKGKLIKNDLSKDDDSHSSQSTCRTHV